MALPFGCVADPIGDKVWYVSRIKTQPGEFLTGEASRLTGVSHRTIDFWAKSKLIVPSIADANGTGSDRLYSFDDLVLLRVARSLREVGVSTKFLRAALAHIKSGSTSFIEGDDAVIAVFTVNATRAKLLINSELKSLAHPARSSGGRSA